MLKVMQIANSHYAKNQVKTNRYNRTGATTVLGGVAFVDSGQTDGDSTSIEAGLDNAVAVSTVRIAKGPRLLVCAQAGVADNGRADWIEGEGIECRVRVDGTTDIAKGDKLKPVNAATHMVKATGANPYTVNEGGSANPVNADVWYVEALEAFTTDGAGIIRGLLYSSGRR